jgi:hypothetical protein
MAHSSTKERTVTNTLTLAAALMLAATPSFAQTQADGPPLSEILATIEADPDFASFESVDWDDDHWEVEYRRTDGSEVELEIDPATGEPRTL